MTFATNLLAKAGLSEDDAKSMAECLVLADTRGVVRLTDGSLVDEEEIS